MHRRDINLSIDILRIHTINTFKIETYSRILTLKMYIKRHIHVYKGI